MLPRSIGKLVNLETLDARGTFVVEMPAEIKRLSKLRYLAVYYYKDYMLDDPQYNSSNLKAMKVREWIGCLEALQKLSFLQVSKMGVEVIKVLGKLTQQRSLGITSLRSEDGRILFGVIEKVTHLKSLAIYAQREDGTLDSDCLSSLPQSLQRFYLDAPINKLSESITRLQYLERLILGGPKLVEDPVKTPKNLHNLISLRIAYDACNGVEMQFEKGVFPKLKYLGFMHLSGLKSLVIEEGALSNLQDISIGPCPKLLKVPTGVQHLKQLEVVLFHRIPIQFQQSLKPGGDQHHIVQHVPRVLIRYKRDGEGKVL